MNELNGTIPTAIGLLPGLVTFAAQQNSLVGQIPFEFESLVRLVVSASHRPCFLLSSLYTHGHLSIAPCPRREQIHRCDP